MTALSVRPATADELELVLSIPSDTPYDIRAGWATGEYRPEWTWLALAGDELVARAVWWGWPGAASPTLMESLDLPGTPDRVDVGAALVAAGMAALVPPGGERIRLGLV